MGGFTRTRYTTLSNSGCVDDATGTDALVFGCYKYVGPTTTTGCDYREIDDYKVGTNA